MLGAGVEVKGGAVLSYVALDMRAEGRYMIVCHGLRRRSYISTLVSLMCVGRVRNLDSDLCDL